MIIIILWFNIFLAQHMLKGVYYKTKQDNLYIKFITLHNQL